MRRIIKVKAPDYWEKFRNRHPRLRYDDLNTIEGGRDVRAKLRHDLVTEQNYLCCYCCCQIDETRCHNEHLWPRSREVNQNSMDYYNLVASCDNQNTCGKKKDRLYDHNKFVSPTDEDCEAHFKFKCDGRIEGATERGKYTVEILNLNAYGLVQARKRLYDECCSMSQLGKAYIKSEYLTAKDEKLHPFADMIQFFYSCGIFDL